MLSVFISINLICNNFFEIRNPALYKLLNNTSIFFSILILVVFILGICRLKSNFNWIILIPFILFVLTGAVFAALFSSIPNEITIKSDTEILLINRDNHNKKIIRQEYLTGLLGENYHSDTITVNEFSQYFRYRERIKQLPDENYWLKLK